jgi:hypothetical protein
LAVSPARTAILRFFGIGAVQIELADRLPAVEPSVPLALGSEIDPSQAPFPILRSDLLGDPDAVYASGEVVDTPLRITRARADSRDRDRALGAGARDREEDRGPGRRTRVLSTFRARPAPASGSRARPHVVVLADAPASARGNTLVWVQEGRTLRTEGAAELDEALRIAKSMR